MSEAAHDDTMIVPTVTPGIPAGWEPDDADSYPVAQPFAATLPSGARFLLRRPNILALMQRGDIPNPLIATVQQALAEGELGDEARDLAARAEAAGRTAEEQLEWERENGLAGMEDAEPGEAGDALQYINVIVFGSVLKPELTFEPPAELGGRRARDGKLSMHVVEDSDKMFIFRWATEQLTGAATFPEGGERGTGADRGGDSGEIRAEAEHAPGVPADA